MAISVVSPDGNYTAEVVKHMTVFGMGEKFRLRENLGKKFTIGSTGDFNHVKRIHWSPDSSTMVFEQYSSLLAVQLPEVKGHYVEAEDAVSGAGSRQSEIERIEFPKPQTFVMYFEDGTTSQTVNLQQYRARTHLSRYVFR